MKQRLFVTLLLSVAVHLFIVLPWMLTKEQDETLDITLSDEPVLSLDMAMFQAPQPVQQEQKKQQKKPKPKPKPKPKKPSVKPKPKEEPEKEPEKTPEKQENQPEMKAQVGSTSNKPQRIAQPVYTSQRAPKYPRRARARGQQGTVTLLIQIDEQGRVSSAKVKKSSGYGLLDRAALKAVKTWRLKPAKRNGSAVIGEAQVDVEFNLT